MWRALEALVSDLTRPSLRQQRAQRFFYQCRGFGTWPPVQQPETATAIHTDGPFIPFHGPGLQRTPDTADSAEESRNAQYKTPEGDDGIGGIEWHAEIELVAPVKDAQGLHAHDVDPPLDAATLPGMNFTAEIDGLVEPPTLLEKSELGLGSSTAFQTVAAPVEKSRAESRQARKQRRIEAGTYRASAEARTKEELVDYQVETVLHKLDAEVDGPRQARAKALERFKKREPAKYGGSERVAAKSDKTSIARDRWDGPKPKKESWQVQKGALERKFGVTGWQPRKRLSPDTVEGVRALHASDPAAYPTETLSEHFKVAPEAIRRILKSKWRPDDEETEDRKNRWERRGAKKWQDMAEQGVRPPAKWRAMGVGSEEGIREDKVPKRKKKSRSDGHLSWDEVVGGGGGLEEDVALMGSLAERIL
ncbi:hypothetical protein LTR36_010619 [Oleoguttula mirabilis]|uniref:Required for respiratory growth protein 9, mitochondrial n=1 Tax=Oleoguttula mirabilis TaxID=1507867 RepID=A0AAV9JR39_9PEZI|nr:hypothetical protein LTR36_010619 [Oleoguttula mirabilis]